VAASTRPRALRRQDALKCCGHGGMGGRRWARACAYALCVASAHGARSWAGAAAAALRAGADELLTPHAPQRVTLAAHSLPLPEGWTLQGARASPAHTPPALRNHAACAARHT
jgi:hypothetical protein